MIATLAIRLGLLHATTGSPVTTTPRPTLRPEEACTSELSRAGVLTYGGHLPELDGARGLAVLLVLSIHSPLRLVIPFGWMGVDLFFVLSGFLITGILLDTRDDPHFFRNFYARRALRILPLYLAWLFFVFAVAPRVPALRFDTAATPIWEYLLYVQNLVPRGPAPSILSVAWSLAVEEQFYVLWPLLVWLLRRRGLVFVLGALILAAPALRWLLLTRGISGDYVYGFTPCRVDTLSLGSLLAIAVRWVPPQTIKALARFSAVVVLPASILASALYLHVAPLGAALVFLGVAIGLTGALGCCLWTNPLARLFRSRVLRAVGQVSYGIYLIHMPVFIVAWTSVDGARLRAREPAAVLSFFATWVLAFALVWVLARLSWRWFESRVLRLKSYFTPPRLPAR
ncbi:MAG: acyltransferase [Anaeromyxobacter sp.]